MLKDAPLPDINETVEPTASTSARGGSLNHWLNTGSAGGEDVVFVAQGYHVGRRTRH